MKKLKSLLLLILFPTLLFSQELPRDKQFIKDKYNIKLNYGIVYSGIKAKEEEKWTHNHSAGLEFNYGFTKWIDAGVFFDLTLAKGHKTIEPPKPTEIINSEGDTIIIWNMGYGMMFHYKIFNYGLNANIHILPFFIDPNFSWVDVYFNTKIGMRTIYAKEVELLENSFYYSIGVGVGVNFTKKIGLMCEYNYSPPFNILEEQWGMDGKTGYNISNTGHILRYGINIRF